MKYPRTYHLPYSPGATSDDKILKEGWFENFRGKEIVITAKLDGENTCMTANDVYARSHGAPTRSPWSRNLWDPQEGLYWKIKPYIGKNEEIFGENLYAEHSIHYGMLPAYWHMFAINDGERWYSWNEIREFADIIEVPLVPFVWSGIFEEEESLKKLVERFANMPEVYGDTREGLVIRLAESFPIEDFSKYVCKWVRPNHVQTDEHWTKNWKKAQLI